VLRPRPACDIIASDRLRGCERLLLTQTGRWLAFIITSCCENFLKLTSFV